jgi:lipopolysaccharide transport system permease protein
MTESSPAFERVLRHRRTLLAFDWRRMLQYRDLLFLLVRRDFVARYQQTVLGPAWFVLQALVATGAFTLVFGFGLRTPTDGLPPHLFYFSGMLLWGFFANIVGGAGNTFQMNAAVFTKVYFPRLIVPLAAMIGSLAPFGLQLLVFLAFYAPAALGATWHAHVGALLLLPLVLAQTAVFGLGVSLLTSSLSAKYRDLQHALPFLLQVWMFVTPVIYPFSQLHGGARWLAALNPLTPLVELFRLGFFGAGTTDAKFLGLSLACTLLFLLLGLVAFQRAERTFADTV